MEWCLSRWTVSEIEALKQPLIDFNLTVYDAWIDKYNDIILKWQLLQTLVDDIADNTKGTNTGTLDHDKDGLPDHDVVDVDLASFQIWIDACGLNSEISEAIEIEEARDPTISDDDYAEGAFWENTGSGALYYHQGNGIWIPTTVFQKNQILSESCEASWDSLSEECSPICDTEVNFSADIIIWAWESRGAVSDDGAGEAYLYYLTKIYEYQIFGEPAGKVETLRTSFTSGNGASIMEYPTPIVGSIVKWELGGVDVEVPESLTLRVSGRLSTPPSSFGTYYWDEGVYIEDSKDTWTGQFLRLTEADGSPSTIIPPGFEIFAGMYPDHPIVTGVDVRPTGTKTITLAAAKSYVHSHYTYQEDEEFRNEWQFMGQGNETGDCEDFAITIIQLLLDNGWSISDLKLCVGYRPASYEPPAYTSSGQEIFKYIGHIWVLAEGTTCLDYVPCAYLESMYFAKRSNQVSGLTWEDEHGYQEVADPYLFEDFDSAVCTLEGTITRKG